MEFKILDMNHTGDGVFRDCGKVYFVRKAVYGDSVLIKDIDVHKKYNICNIDRLLVKGSDRRNVVCPYYDFCGGCQIMGLRYSKQIVYKKNKVKDIFKRFCNMDISPEIIFGDEYGYRNKIRLQVSDGRVGLYEASSHIVRDISSCLLVDDKINDVIMELKDLNLEGITSITIRSFGNEVMVLFEGNVSKQVVELISGSVTSLYVNDKLVWGREGIIFRLGNYKYRVCGRSFFQVNTLMCEKLYDKVCEYLVSDGGYDSRVLDLYCGVGSIGIYVSSFCREVMGVEIYSDAIRDASINKKINGVDNVSFVCGDCEDIILENNDYDVVIVDPPRAGVSKKARDLLMKIGSEKIIYVSCDPFTLVRDIKYFGDKYYLDDITLVDMFPNTYHVESVCLLKHR